MRMRLLAIVGLAVLLLAGAASDSVPIDLVLVEDGTSGLQANAATDGGQLLVRGFPASVRLRPATCAASSCSRVAPDAGDEGMPLGDVASWSAQVCPPGDQAFTGTGEVQLWTLNGITNRWGQVPGLELAMEATSGNSCLNFPVEENSLAAAATRAVYVPVGVGVTGNDGGSVTVAMTACRWGRRGGCGP